MTIRIHVSRIKGDRVTMATYSAWVPSALTGCHSTIGTFDEDEQQWWHEGIRWVPAKNPQRWGRVGTEFLPADIAALPAMSEERKKAVADFQEALYDRAYEAIILAYPEAASGFRSMGEIKLITVRE